ncbi:MAG: hypothetical protein EBX50_09875 [Chitinophagia bacterium]|nr:hypothetical protein [Chitinophagia bacterium]
MEIVIHRVNTLAKLTTVPNNYGCEIDIRAFGSELILNHEPFISGERLSDFLENYKHGILILNVKEAGIETAILDMVAKAGISRYFLLDVEFPYIYNAARRGIRKIAVRFSEDEPIQLIQNYKEMVDWVWIDTITHFPVTKNEVPLLESFQTCIVCPERWGRPQDIPLIKRQMQDLNFKPTAVMTSLECTPMWTSQ